MDIHAISGYELGELVGEGPHGIVYKAHDLNSGRWVAVKIFHSLEIDDPSKLLNLKHPHLASVCDSGCVESHCFVVTEYVSKGTIKDHIRSLRSVGDCIPFDQILACAANIGDALVYAHGQGVTHGNLKAENVMFGDDGLLKLTDFGLSEVSLGDGKQSDLAAFGMLLYELTAGSPVLPGMSPAPVDRVRKDLPIAFTRILARAVGAAGSDRYEDLSALLADLRRLSSPPTLTRVGPFETNVSPTLSPDRLLAGRFKIIAFIARGGMGDVYEAEDLELRERVALKMVRPEIAGSDQAMDRFKREIHLARRVTHPNVCRIFDLFHDGTGSEKLTFLTMELLRGETLRQRLQRTGVIGTNEALPIVEQMAAGLAAAHRAGVIHRDFKSSNVILVDSGGDGKLRAVVTDFGLARSKVAGETMATLPGASEAFGTPAYLAPEQLEGGQITAAADIYAFGVVLYEMSTGSLPFDGDSPIAIALKRLQGPPPSPRQYKPDLDVVWEAGILRCLERDPAQRFPDTEHLVRALAEGTTVARVMGRRRRISTAIGQRRMAIVGATLVLVALLAGALLIGQRAGDTAVQRQRRTIAVLGFTNLTGQADAAWLSTALSEMLTTELAAGEKLRAIPGENVSRMRIDLALPESSSFAPDTLARIRSYLGADLIIYGSYVVLNGAPTKVRIDLRLQESVQGNVVATISEEGYSADLLELVSRSGAALRNKLDVGTLQASEAASVLATLPATTKAAQFYAEGLERLRVFDAAAARTSLEKAVVEDGQNAPARAALATSLSMLGFATKAKEQAQIALDLSTRLSREDQLLIQGRSRESTLEWGKAVETYRTLFGFFPDNLDYGLRLAGAQTSAGYGKDALSTVEQLRKLAPPDGQSPRIDLAEARAAGALSDFKRQQRMASQAAAKGKERGEKLLVAGARLIEGNALAGLGELGPARAAFEAAKEIYVAAGDRWDSANASTNIAYVVMQKGDFDTAEDIYQKSLSVYRELGDQKGIATVLTSMGSLYRYRGDLSQAKKLHEQALAIHRDIGNRFGEAASRTNLANILSLSGNQKAARAMYETAVPVFREIGDRNALAKVLSNLGDLVSQEGDLSRAKELYEESFSTFKVLEDRSSQAYELSRLGELDLINGDLLEARKKHEEALTLRKQLGEKGGIGESQLALAQIALHEGDVGSAELSAKAAAEEFKAAERSDDEASAMAVLARSFLVRGKYPESSDAIRRAEELSAKSNDSSVRLSVAITSASVQAAVGDTNKAQKDLLKVIAEARAAGLVQLELEARLSLGYAEVESGRLEAGRARLEALEKEAASRGYKSIAERAAAARKKAPARTTA